MRSGIRRRIVSLGAVLLVVAGCNRPHEGWEPPPVETSTHFLQRQIDAALRLVETARAESPEGSEERLSAAADKLEQLSMYYLPMLEATERTYDAHRFYYYGETQRAETEIRAVDEILGRISSVGGDGLLRALKRSRDLVRESQTAMRDTPEKAPGLLSELAIELNDMTLRGGLVLPEDWPERAPAEP